MSHIKLSSNKTKCPEPESNQRHRDFQSLALPTELSGQKIAGTGFEPMTFGLWARRASRLLHPAILSLENILEYCTVLLFSKVGGEGFEPSKAMLTELQSAPFGHSGIHPKKPMIGLEPITCWLQISCSANWAISACTLYYHMTNIMSIPSFFKDEWDLQGSNLWPSACKADALPAELRPHK